MTRDEARAQLYWFVDESTCAFGDPDFDAALDEFERAVKAEMPCYLEWAWSDDVKFTIIDAFPESEEQNQKNGGPPCPSCKARSEG